MAVARFLFKISDRDGNISKSGVPVTVLANVAGSPGAPVHVYSDDAGTVEITGQQENFTPDATGKTSGTEGVSTTHGIVLTNEHGNVNFVVQEGDYFLSWADTSKPMSIEVGDPQLTAFAETVNVKAGAISAANNVNPPGTQVPTTGSVAFTARVGTAPTTSALVLRINQNGTPIGSISIAPTTTKQAGQQVALTAITAAVSGTNIFTLTLGTGHGVIAGETVVLKGFTPAAYNGAWQVASVTSTTIVLTATGMVAGTPVNATVFGTGVVGMAALPTPVTAGDVFTYDVIQIGSGTAGSDLAIDIASS